MSRIKRTSAKLERANIRLQGLKSMGATLDFGNGLSVVALETQIETTQQTLDEYNQLLFTLDEKTVVLKESEKQTTDLSERMIAGVAAKYGKDSSEYAQAGGTRKSDIKRSPRVSSVKTGSRVTE